MNINKSKPRELIDYVLIYLLLFFSTGFQLSVYSGTVRLLFYFGLILLLIAFNIRRILFVKTNQLSLLILIFVLCNVILTTLVNSEGYNQILITTALFLTAYIYTMYYSFDDFIKIFIKIMSFTSIYSLILYFAANLLPQAIKYLPVVYNIRGLSAYNAFFSIVSMDGYLIRNQGFFWEPGAFQTFINIALIFNLFVFKENYKRNMIIFGITLFTTYSTSAYVVGLMIILAFVACLLTNATWIKQKRTLIFICVIIVLLIMGIIFYNGLPNNAKYQLFGKVALYIDTGNYSSTSVRYESSIYSFYQFLDNPIFGKGSQGMSEVASDIGYNMNTNTIANWFAMFGIFMGLSMNYGLYRLCKRLECGKIIRLLLFAALLLSLFSEDYVRHPFILLFVFYGYHYYSSRPPKYNQHNKQLNY